MFDLLTPPPLASNLHCFSPVLSFLLSRLLTLLALLSNTLQVIWLSFPSSLGGWCVISIWLVWLSQDLTILGLTAKFSSGPNVYIVYHRQDSEIPVCSHGNFCLLYFQGQH